MQRGSILIRNWFGFVPLFDGRSLEGAQVRDEFFEVFFDGFPFEVIAGVLAEEHAAAFVVFVQAALEIWDDFGW